MKKNKLKGIIVEKQENYDTCSKAVGVSITTFSKKMNGKSNFDIAEINKLVNFLDITKEVAADIFFDEKLA